MRWRVDQTGPWHRALCVAFLACSIGVIASVLPGCGDRSPTSRESARRALPESPRVVVSIPPLEGLVRPLLNEDAEIVTLLGAGQSAHGWEPTPAAIAELKRADVVVLIGMGLEPRIDSLVEAGLPNDPLVLRMGDMLGMDHATHDYNAHTHVHADGHVCVVGGDGDPHLWLDPVLAARFVRAAGPLISTPERQSAWVARIEALERELAVVLEPVRGKSIVSHHAAFGRLASHYGLEVAEVLQPIESAEPTPGELASAIKTIDERGIEVIFIEPQFSPAAAEFVASATGARLATLDPLGRGDWEETVRTIGQTIARELAD